MFATIKSLIPEPRQADQPRRYVGRHRQPETLSVVPPPDGFTSTPLVPGFDSPAEPVPVTAADGTP
jgi:hypothetical protein